MASLREKQIVSIKRVLNLNAPIPAADAQNEANNELETAEPAWKVLVYDDHGRDVLSAVMRTNDLRAMGITIHLNINTTRHTIPDVPVIYLIEPSQQNLSMVTSDLSRSLYTGGAYINFTSSISRDLLENFAENIASSGTSESLSQLYDQYLNFIVSEPDLFHLNMQGAYHLLNSAQTSDQQLDVAMERVVSGLFSVCVTMGVIPIIRCPKGGAAELVSAKLDRKLRDHFLNSKTSLFSDQKTSQTSRPVLILVDRQIDLCPMFSHSWIYQSLVYDVLSMHLNKITMDVPIDKDHPEKGSKKTSYDLSASDYFWSRNASLPFPQVADDVTDEWNKYQSEADALTKQTGSSSLDDLSGETNQFAAHLKGAMAALPELQERKATISMHMNLLEALMEGIKNRKLDQYFQIEEEVQERKHTKANILEIIKDADKGNEPLDKLRLFLQWYLTTESDLSRSDMESFTNALDAAGADTTAIKYVKTVRQLARMNIISSAPNQPTQTNQQSLFGGFTSLSSRVTDRFKAAGLDANFEGVLSGIKNFLPKNSDLTLTKVTESIMDPQGASSSAISKTESYLYFDPRSANARGTLPPASQARQNQGGTVGRGIEATFGQKRQGYSEAIVFSVGGGSMDEYGNLQEWAKRTSASGASGTGQKRRVIYGATALLSANEFINQDLVPLGKES